MRRCLLESASIRAEIDPVLGAAVTDLSLRGPDGQWHTLLRRAPADARSFLDAACFLMAPWCNRIPGGQLHWKGVSHNITRTWQDGSAIHGEVCRLPWRIVQRSPVSVILEITPAPRPGSWPWHYSVVARYEADDGAFHADLSLTNTGEAPMPAGLGFHPYFLRQLWSSGDRPTLRAPVTGRYPARDQIPESPAVADGSTQLIEAGTPLDALGPLDDVYRLGPGPVELAWPASGVRATFSLSTAFGHLHVFNPPAPSRPRTDSAPGAADQSFLPHFCVEPVTQIANAINRQAEGWGDTGLMTLSPGASLHARWSLLLAD